MAVYPDKSATFKAEENIIVGNVCLYGAVKVWSHNLLRTRLVSIMTMGD